MLGFRWRRDSWLIGSVVLAVLIVGSAGWYGSRSGRPGSAAASAPVGPLPGDGVGRAELLYACGQDCRPVVRLVDGREFEVPTDAPSVRDLTLSPDGRWLGYPLGSGFVLRDLVGTDEHRLGSRTVTGRLASWAWSADSGDDQPVAVLRFGGASTTTNRFDLVELGPGRWTVLGVGGDGRGFVRNGEGRTVVWYLDDDGTFRSGADLLGDLEMVTPGTAHT